MINLKYFQVDYNDLESIKECEEFKSNAENKGYNLIKTTQIGFNSFVMEYEREV